MTFKLNSTMHCPDFGFSRTEEMPTDAYVWHWECPSYGVLLKPKPWDCCGYCSYGETPCPSLQIDAAAAANPTTR